MWGQPAGPVAIIVVEHVMGKADGRRVRFEAGGMTGSGVVAVIERIPNWLMTARFEST